jgi:hypothetical protein
MILFLVNGNLTVVIVIVIACRHLPHCLSKSQLPTVYTCPHLLHMGAHLCFMFEDCGGLLT